MKNWLKKNITNRKLIENKETRISYTQIIGFILILTGVLLLFIGLYNPFSGASNIINGEKAAITFFIIMLGVSLAFPSLLKDHSKSISTMRIVVFMMTNVIAVLLLKIGWEVENLSEIELDTNWVAIIAFIFGAKATQAYFESKLAVPKKESERIGTAALEYSHAELAKLAVEQNQQYLKVKFPNILTISDAVDDMSKEETHVIAIYLEDNNTKGIPDKLEVKMPDGSVRMIATEIISDVGRGNLQIGKEDRVKTPDSINGSICCMVKLNNGDKAVVTSGHVYSNKRLRDYYGLLSKEERKDAILNGNKKIGQWIFQTITQADDIALIKLENENEPNNLISFADTGFYELGDNSVKKEKVTLVSHNSKTREAYIIDYNIALSVDYLFKPQDKRNVILIGSTDNRKKCKSVSKDGDSGGLVYHTKEKKLVGLILGSDERFTWVLPIKEILDYYKITLI